MRGLDLPRGREREIVHDARDREYRLRGSETRTLSTVGAFRVVPARELRDHVDRPADPRDGDLRHLREQSLIETVRIPGSREYRDIDGREDRVDVEVTTLHAGCVRHCPRASPARRHTQSQAPVVPSSSTGRQPLPWACFEVGTSGAGARARRENRGKTITEQEAVGLVKAKRRARAMRRAGPDRESRR